jgi:hypothetical protein
VSNALQECDNPTACLYAVCDYNTIEAFDENLQDCLGASDDQDCADSDFQSLLSDFTHDNFCNPSSNGSVVLEFINGTKTTVLALSTVTGGRTPEVSRRTSHFASSILVEANRYLSGPQHGILSSRLHTQASSPVKLQMQAISSPPRPLPTVSPS